MDISPYFSPLSFARRDIPYEDSRYALFGVPYDSTESYRGGSRMAPGAIREASREIEDYDVLEGFDLLDIPLCDLGDIEVSPGDTEETLTRVRDTVKMVLEDGKVPIIIGGEHTVTTFAGEAYPEDTAFLIFDAHLDFRDDYIGNKYSHACVTRRLMERFGPENIFVIGVRSGSREEFDDARELGLKYLDFNDCGDISKITKEIERFVRGRKVYVSIDMDVLDPKEARGVGNPEPPGFMYMELLECLRSLIKGELIGFDLVEVLPQYDSYTPVLAAKLILKTLIFANK